MNRTISTAPASRTAAPRPACAAPIGPGTASAAATAAAPGPGQEQRVGDEQLRRQPGRGIGIEGARIPGGTPGPGRPDAHHRRSQQNQDGDDRRRCGRERVGVGVAPPGQHNHHQGDGNAEEGDADPGGPGWGDRGPAGA